MLVYEKLKDGFGSMCNSEDIIAEHESGATIMKNKDGNITMLEPWEDIPEGFIEPYSIIVKPRKVGE